MHEEQRQKTEAQAETDAQVGFSQMFMHPDKGPKLNKDTQIFALKRVPCNFFHEWFDVVAHKSDDPAGATAEGGHGEGKGSRAVSAGADH